MALSSDLANAAGTYVGTGGGAESGAFVSRIAVSALPNGGALVQYEALTRDEVLHTEVTMLVAGPDGRDRLYVSHSESPHVTEMTETEPGSHRFEAAAVGPYAMAIVIERPEPDRIIYAWWWGASAEEAIEQSRADARRH